MSLFTTIILLPVGFYLLVKGADWLIDGAGSLARRLGVPTLVVGLTVVALGTSTPELVVNLLSAFGGTTDIAIGNIIGSNIANIALILGISAATTALTVKSSTIYKEIPFAMLAALLVGLLASDIAVDGGAANVLTRIDGIVLLSLAVVYMYYVSGLARSGQADISDMPKLSSSWTAAYVLFGIAALGAGGKLVVESAVSLAAMVGVSQRVIGLTVVAVGTSLPELVTSVVAARRKQYDLAIGNVIGSNIVNVFLVLGLSAFIAPLPFSGAALTDVMVCIGVTLMLFLAMFVGQKRTLERWQGVTFVLVYVAYVSFLVAKGG